MSTGRAAITAAEAATGAALDAARVWLQLAAWGARASLLIGTRVTGAAVDRDRTTDLVFDLSSALRGTAREFLGIAELDRRLQKLEPSLTPQDGAVANGAVTEQVLRARAIQLLRASADVRSPDGAHPAHVFVLEQLAPDEARVLRLLAADGPQPAVDVRAANLIGAGSQLIAPGLNMIGAEAGCRDRDRVPAYMNNLERLGLIQFSDRPLEDPITYQVLEAQPDVLSTIKQTTRAKSIHRSIRLTAFGEDFCAVCVPLDLTAVE